MPGPPPTLQFPQLRQEQAKAALREANALFQLPDSVARLEDAVLRAGDDPVRKMTMLLPVVEDIQRDCMAKYGFQGTGAVMAAMMQIQMHSMSDPEMMQDVQFMMAKLNGR